MNTLAIRVAVALIAVAAFSTQRISSNQKASSNQKSPVGQKSAPESPAVTTAVDRGAKWLVSTQGKDGGWGQDGDGTSRIVTGQRMESNGNDVANTAVAAMALLRAGKQYQHNVDRALAFILERIEQSPNNGLAVTNVQGTQIQRKLGPYIDTFLASMLLTQVDGTLARAENVRVRRGLEKCIAKIEKNQKGDGSWNLAGGWAPVLGTSLASRSLYDAKNKGVRVDASVLAKAESYTVNAMSGGVGSGTGGGRGSGRGGSVDGIAGTTSETVMVTADAAGVPLYQGAQALEQLSRTEADRKKNAKTIAAINGRLSSERFVEGYGSIGGEEFFSYLNLSDGLKRTGGKAWTDWHAKITDKIVKLQNNDGTWVGHHCITGRVAVTAAAILNLTVDREISEQATSR